MDKNNSGFDSNNTTKNNLERSLLAFALIFILILFNETIAYSKVGIIFTYIQAAIVIYYLLTKSYLKAILMHTSFNLAALEWPANLMIHQDIYTYRTVSFFGISVSTLILLLIFSILIFTIKHKFNIKISFIAALLILFTASITGLIGILFDSYFVEYFISDLQYWLIVLMSFFVFESIIKQNINIAYKYEWLIICVLCSRSIIKFIGITFNLQKGNYGGIPIFSYDSLDFLIPFIIFGIRTSDSIYIKILLAISWFIGIITVGGLEASGKGILFTGISILILLMKILTTKHIIRKFIGVVLIITIILFMFTRISILNESNQLFKIKYNQATSLISFKWLKNPDLLPDSPKARVLELYNTIAYYTKRPIFFLTGRGFGGYFEESAYYMHEASDKGGYSTKEVITRKFVNPHESLNLILLKFGFFGTMYWIMILATFFKKSIYNFSPFIQIIGFILIGVFIGFSFKLAFIIGFILAVKIKSRGKMSILY